MATADLHKTITPSKFFRNDCPADCQPANAEESTAFPSKTERSRIGRLLGVQIVGIGSAVPEQRVLNEDLAALGYDADWILQRTGIKERRHAPPEMSTSDLAVAAARNCIAASGVDPAEIDLVLLGTFTPDMLCPSTAGIVQDKLGLCAPAMDIQAACASFAFALLTGMQYVASGCSRRALVIGADCNSRIVNPADKQTYPLFGDGAGAVLLAPGNAGPGNSAQGILAYAAGSEGSGANLICRPMGGTREPFAADRESQGRQFLHMEGRPVFKWAIRLLKETTADVLAAANMTVADIDLVVFHQANMRIIHAASDELGIEPKKFFNNVDRYGNTSAGSIPLALDEAFRQGLIKPGNNVLVSGFGAGLAWGTLLLRW